MKRKILIIILLTFGINANSQSLFSEKFDDCHQTKFSFCLDCGDTKSEYQTDINEYFKNEFKDISSKVKGKIQVQLIIDSTGNQCVKSLQSELNINYKKLKIKERINSMTGWKSAISKEKPKSVSIILEFIFNEGQVTTSYKRFEPKNTSNMKSVGTVEIKNKDKFKNKLDENSFKVYNTQNSIIPWDMSRSITIDHNKTIWYGTDNGIVKIVGEKMEVLNHKNSSLKSTMYDKNKTSSIMNSVVDLFNNKWFSDGYNTYKYDEKNWSVYDSINSPVKWVTGIYADKFGNVYFTGFDGLNKYDGKEWSTMNIENSKIPSNRVMGVFVDTRKRLWIGTNKGNIMIDGSQVENFEKTENPLKTSTLTKGYEDKEGNIWFALYEKFPQTKGFAKYSIDGKWTVINSENAKIPRNDVLDFVIDEKNNIIWLSINRVGLCRFDGNEWTTYTPENSKVPSTYIQNITVDDNGNLWCATHSGLLKIEYK